MQRKTLVTLLALILLAVFLAPLASLSPDGLERVADDAGFLAKAETISTAPWPDYLFPGVTSTALATVLAGGIGTIAVFLLIWGLMKLLIAGKGQHEHANK